MYILISAYLQSPRTPVEKSCNVASTSGNDNSSLAVASYNSLSTNDIPSPQAIQDTLSDDEQMVCVIKTSNHNLQILFITKLLYVKNFNRLYVKTLNKPERLI